MLTMPSVMRLFQTCRLRLLSPGNVAAKPALFLLVGLGILLRLIHFLRCPSVWHDEAAVLVNAIQLDFAALLGPLIFHEAAPPLFLFAERGLCLVLGDSIMVFRLLPLAASLFALILVAALARRLLSAPAAIWAVALFTTSDRMLYHAIEAKPYALDVALAAGIAYGYVAFRHWPLWKQHLAAMAIFPWLMWLSFPACFMIGGWFIAQWPALIRSRSRYDGLAALALYLAVGVSFVTLLGPINAQHDSSMESCWTAGFPNWHKPLSIPIWFLRSTVDIFNYCLAPQGWALTAMIMAGAYALSRRDWPLTLLLASPMGLTLLAAVLGKYPYCGLRVLAFMTPAICLLAARGVDPVLLWLRSRSAALMVVGWAALAIPFIHSTWRLVDPWQRADTYHSAQYVLDHKAPGDGVGFNHWEGEYYLRHVPHAAMGTIPSPHTSERLWYIVVAADPAAREELLQAVAISWSPAERHEFAGAVTALFVPRTPANVSTSDGGVIP